MTRQRGMQELVAEMNISVGTDDVEVGLELRDPQTVDSLYINIDVDK